MPIESGTTIAELDKLWPLSGDFVLEGDNHLRLIKAVLKAQFPGVNGDGFDRPITATEAEINYLSGLTGNVQQQINDLISEYQGNLYAPKGTVMMFYQAAPPVGWTQIKNNDNSMLRVVNSGAGDSGGTDNPIDFSFAHIHTTEAHTLTIAEMPSHTHKITADNRLVELNNSTNGGNGNGGFDGGQNLIGIRQVANEGGGQAHSHGDTGSAGGEFKPRYINVMIAAKD